MAWQTKSARPLAMLTALAVLVGWLTGQSSANDDAKTKAPTKPLAFSHSAHATHYDVNNCAACHSDSSAVKPAPTTRSHAPCMASGCHIDDFLSTGPRTKSDDLAAYTAAASFCATCHKSKNGAPPSRFAKAKADALFESKAGADYHVEMNHREHSETTACSTCHKTDATTFKLVRGGPGHGECASCHTDDGDQPMSRCTSCHRAPGPSEYFTKPRKPSDVRVCSADADDDKPCFRHEREEHRFLPDKSPLECSSCHFKFKGKSQGTSYETLADVKAAPMMNNKRDQAHKSCGVGGCHRRDVDDSMGTGRCVQCHSAKFMANSLTD